MSSFFAKLLGINWKTTISGIMVIVALVGKVIVAVKTKDFGGAYTIFQELIPDVIALLVALGLLNAKDNNTTGAGEASKKVESDGTVIKAA